MQSCIAASVARWKCLYEFEVFQPQTIVELEQNLAQDTFTFNILIWIGLETIV